MGKGHNVFVSIEAKQKVKMNAKVSAIKQRNVFIQAYL